MEKGSYNKDLNIATTYRRGDETLRKRLTCDSQSQSPMGSRLILIGGPSGQSLVVLSTNNGTSPQRCQCLHSLGVPFHFGRLFSLPTEMAQKNKCSSTNLNYVRVSDPLGCVDFTQLR
ncbi:unnamed protein product [Nezara viridula]|uniref:Uncharacterized protein n=1 Tax=Nezara viridula TaxID=85310 RepID=A0A9P0EEM1_NEZVI|nr:unnamed protein product [Nezara viridula]